LVLFTIKAKPFIFNIVFQVKDRPNYGPNSYSSLGNRVSIKQMPALIFGAAGKNEAKRQGQRILINRYVEEAVIKRFQINLSNAF
jgi:hypothetical protein